MENTIGAYARETAGLGLKDLILKKDECIKQGYYWRHMPIKEEQKVEYQVFYAKLLQIAVNAKELIRYVAGSVVVKEAGECIAGIYTPEGHAAVLSTGVLLHVWSMTEVVRFMALNDYEKNPGINEGDVFFNNDPHCGGQHAQDQFIISPIFYEGRLVAWVGGMSHEMETGATGPGGYDPSAVNRYYEGLLMSPTKVGTNNTLNNDFKITVEHGTRDATIWLMDTQAKMSANIYMRNAIIELVKQYGIEFYLEAVQEIVEDGRRATLEKIKSRFLPGVYRGRTFVDAMVPNRESRCIQSNMEMTVDKDGYLNFDLEGSSQEGPWPWNGTSCSTRATFFCALAQNLMYDCKFNAGSYLAIRSKIPDRSVYACSLQSATHKYIGSVGAALTGELFSAISRMYYAAGYLEEVVAPAVGSISTFHYGQDESGRRATWAMGGAAAGGSGGRALKDGIHTHYFCFNPEGDCADAEVYDRTTASMYLARSHGPDSGGFGKYRGGCSLDLIAMIHKAGNVVINTGGVNYHVPNIQGLMGGYPTPPLVLNFAFDTNMKDLMARGKPYPLHLGPPEETEMEKYVCGTLDIAAPTAYPNTDLHNYDLIQIRLSSAAGFGDPLERDPKAIVKDLADGATTERAARDVYGAVIKKTGPLPQDLDYDREQTASLRKKLRAERGRKAIPARQYIAQQRERLLKGDIPRVCALMINDLLRFSPKWRDRFKKEWGLPASFEQIPILVDDRKEPSLTKLGQKQPSAMLKGCQS